MMMKTVFLALGLMAAPAVAQSGGEIDYPAQSLGYEALAGSGDYALAEAQIRADRSVLEDDPARLINLGQVMAHTGRSREAAALFRRAMAEGEVDLILADGRVMNSRDAAELALRRMRPEPRLSSR